MTEELEVVDNLDGVVPVLSKLEPLSPDEQKLAAFLLQREKGSDMRLYMPEDMPDDQLVQSVTACLKVAASMDRALRYLHPIIGRLIQIMSTRPDVIEAFEAKDITDFCNRVCKQRFGVNASDAWFSYKIVKMFPNITPEEYVRAKPSSIKAIGYALKWDESNPKKADYLSYAQCHNRDNLMEYMAHDGTDIGELDLVSINTKVTANTRLRWNQFLYSDLVKNHCGTTSMNEIINRILDELEAEWTAIAEFEKRKANDFE